MTNLQLLSEQVIESMDGRQKGNQQQFIRYSKDQNVGQSYQHILYMMDTFVHHGSITTEIFNQFVAEQVLPSMNAICRWRNITRSKGKSATWAFFKVGILTSLRGRGATRVFFNHQSTLQNYSQNYLGTIRIFGPDNKSEDIKDRLRKRARFQPSFCLNNGIC